MQYILSNYIVRLRAKTERIPDAGAERGKRITNAQFRMTNGRRFGLEEAKREMLSAGRRGSSPGRGASGGIYVSDVGRDS
jgi:hypothetical protein